MGTATATGATSFDAAAICCANGCSIGAAMTGTTDGWADGCADGCASAGAVASFGCAASKDAAGRRGLRLLFTGS